ncbi:hypothetical protein [Finegoldia magna]|uniref:Uncharacterized protein n=1 Tax=Finegoldia magna (strain ATCC 29328 / DSM 20472 / WAL 2508) TaxID=334413 RepID=B0S4D4_FINM2|nr:hypothetical protein [Finegoldia magna]UEA71193.1 hypothetical protein LK415_08755 [Finegoldia magna]BAG09125.1 hypothetical protein FMG_P0076 [Finegoldia magna ATCC 29328]
MKTKHFITTLTIIMSVISIILSFTSIKIVLNSKNTSKININQSEFYQKSNFKTLDVSNLFGNVSKEYQEKLDKKLKNWKN